MACLPIAPTPVLVGEEAERFYQEMEENLKIGMSDEEFFRIERTFRGIVENNPWLKGTAGNGRY